MTRPFRRSLAEPRNSGPHHALPVAMASAVAVCLLIASVSPARANLVTDPGFESCTASGNAPPGWTVSGDNAGCSAVQPHSGSWDASFGPGGTGTVSQSFTTTTGDIYDFSFWVGGDAASGNSFTASFGADQVLDLISSGVSLPYTFENFTVTAAAASTTIAFTGTAFRGGVWNLDDVSVTAVPAPPLSPLGAALVGLFLLARGAYRRRRPA